MTVGIVILLVLLIFIFALGTFFRVYNLNKTGLEVDESTNYDIATSMYKLGYPSTKPEFDASRQIFLFHPFFGYWLMAAWFKVAGGPSLLSARIFNVMVSLIVLMLIFAFVNSIASRKTALLATLFVALDGWIVMINRMNYLENVQLILIIAGVWIFWKAIDWGDKIWPYIAAGIALGIAISFKHIGVYLVLAVIANWLLMRKHHRGHLITLLTIVAIVAAYVGLLYWYCGQNFISQQVVQFDRLFGFIGSRGLNYGPVETAKLIVQRYWIYITTVIALVLGWPFVIWRYIQNFFRKGRDTDTVVLSWALAGFLFAVGSRLKATHYLILWLVPLFIFLAIEIMNRAKGKWLILVVIVAVLFLVASIFTWNYRFVQVKGDTLRNTAKYINAKLPPMAIVATDEYVAALIKQPYMRIDTVTAKRLEQADYLAIYQSSSETIKDLPNIIQMEDKYCEPIARFTGFKDNIELCKINHEALLRLEPQLEK